MVAGYFKNKNMNTDKNLLFSSCLQRHFLRWIGLALFITVLDQISKNIILHLNPEQPIVITPFFNIILRFNRGAAFSFLNAASGWQNLFFSITALLITIIIIRWLYQITEKRFCLQLSLSFVLGGASGNLIDRLARGNVIDFLDFYIKNWHWPTFNLADSAIVIGVFLMFFDMMKNK